MGTITATVTLVNRLYRPVEYLLNIQVDFTRSLALFTRIFDYFDKESTIVSPENGEKPEVKNEDICFEHVVFSYEPDRPLLNDIDFTIPGGSMYAIVGGSGSGKSTVVNLIPRLYDVLGGKVTIAGVDVRDFDLAYLRSCIGVVTQDTYLFNGTIRDNLLYARPDATEEEIIEAAKNAGLDPSSFPIVGIDATADGRQAIKDGTMAMSVFQDPNGQGGGAVQAAVNLINGAALNEGTSFDVDETGFILWVPFEEVTPDNVADYDNR